MKTIKILSAILALTLTFLSHDANAKGKNYKHLSFRPLISHLKAKAKRLHALDGRILKFSVSPANPKAGDDVVIFVQPLTSFSDSDIILEGTFDNTAVTDKLEHPASELWVFDAGVFSEVTSHTFSAKIYVQDQNDAKTITDAIAVLDAAITDLNDQIANATDPAVIAQLTAERDDKIAQKNDLLAALAQLKTQVGEESTNFSIAANDTLPGYPAITSVTPDIFKPTGTSFTIMGQNFGISPVVKVGGVDAIVTSASDTEIVATSPSLPLGPKDLEVRVNVDGAVKNVIRQNAVFISDENFNDPNTAPVAVARAITPSISYGVQAQLTAIDSFDANKHPLSFEWRFASVPQGGTESVGTVVSTSQDFSFTPSAPGVYALSLKVTQTEVPGLSSALSLAVVEVAAPVNGVPQPSSTPVSVSINQTATSQISVIDEAWQSHSYQITQQGQLGTATVSSTGLVTYTAGAQGGQDQVWVLVMDNGNPPASSFVSVPVQVTVPNENPVLTAPNMTSHSEAVASQVTATDPDEGQTVSLAITTQPQNGTASISPEGLVTYTPNSGFVGTDSIVVTGTDSGTPPVTGSVTITANVLANNAPSATATGFSIGLNATKTTQISVTEDAGQTDSFQIMQQGTLGTASVSASGLVSYTAGSTEGADTVVVRVTDSGNPALFSDVSISVNVVSNFAPTVPAVIFLIRTRGVPYQVAFGTANAALISDSDGSIVSATWDFGDGTHERALDLGRGNILHNYMAAGTYTATLTATDNLGATGSNSVVVNVVDTDIPTAKFRESPTSGATPLTVNFDASEAGDADGIVTYLWLFGDGTPETVTTSPTISHTYNNPGTFQVRLRTRDSFRAEGIGFANIVAGSTVPGTISNADFQVGPPREVLLGTPLAFDGSRSFNPNVSGVLSTYNWQFADFLAPDGTGTATGITTSYTYPLARNYFPALQVISGAGGVSQSKFLEVFNVNAGHAPRSIIRASAISGVAPLTINVDGGESYDYDGTIQSYLWDFADGTRFSGPSSTSHTFTAVGTYGVLLEVTDNDGNTTFNFQNITVTASKKELPKVKNLTEYDPDREYQRQVLTNACWGSSSGEACYELGQMYQQDGDTFTAQELSEKACGLGYQQACGNRR